MSVVAVEAAETEHAAPYRVTNRMAVAVLAMVGVFISLYMTAWKFGFISQLACGSGGCSLVQNSPWAVQFGVPVPVIGLAGYGALLVASLVGVQPSFSGSRGIAFIIAAGASTGLLFTAYLTYLEAFVIHAWCRWCIISAVLATLIFVFALPEFRRFRRSA
jgi:uncharacterized membrane protein